MISGRNLFKKAKPLIGLFGLLFYLLPRFFVVFLWDATSKYSQLPFIALRYLMLKRMCEGCGDNVRIGANVRILNWHNLKIRSEEHTSNSSHVRISYAVFCLKKKKLTKKK